MFTPAALLPFLTGSLAIAISGNAAYQLLTNWFGTTNTAIVKIGISALLIVVGAALAFSSYLNRLKPCPPLIGKKPPDKRKALILLVSNEPLSRRAVAWHEKTLRYCWLLCSAQSASIAESIKQSIVEQGVKAQMIMINDVFDPLEYKQKVERIYSDLPADCSETEVILDFTGMTACASVGSVLASLSEFRSIQYTPAQYDASLKAVVPLDPVEVILHWGLLSMSATSEASKTNLERTQRKAR